MVLTSLYSVALGGLHQGGAGHLRQRRGMFRAPGQWTVDFSLFKDIPITERFKMQFRSEFFNLLNHANFGGPTTSLDSAAYGTIRSTTVNARLVHFALKLIF